jgi:hypothetical protein
MKICHKRNKRPGPATIPIAGHATRAITPVWYNEYMHHRCLRNEFLDVIFS